MKEQKKFRATVESPRSLRSSESGERERERERERAKLQNGNSPETLKPNSIEPARPGKTLPVRTKNQNLLISFIDFSCVGIGGLS